MSIIVDQIARILRESKGIAAKADIASVVGSLGIAGDGAIPLGDDCAAIADGDGYLLFAIEGFMNEFVAKDPWFAGWCGVMVNISDIAAMGGRPLAVVNALWSEGLVGADPVLEGMRDASRRFGVPVVGGHTNLRTDRSQLAVAILGRANKLLTSFDAKPGERLLAAVDLRGRYREPFSNWEAATDAPAERLRGDLDLLPRIAEAGLSKAAKDISQAGIVGTAAMLAECSGVAINIDLSSLPKPEGVSLERWLMTFPSFGYLLTVTPDRTEEISALFAKRGIACAEIGEIAQGSSVSTYENGKSETIWDFAHQPLIGCGSIRREQAFGTEVKSPAKS
ncbi:sll0787 family AIR synthase-like protein [Ensifer adhaerens]|uniref:sll0787 family AIR synthase-like protein n=1 Tax=Ensifer canadensis TaxID=555315 RepID=UPI00148F76FB|nr:sll0787 family AIR synthase-like protein [Ensifer canadensis]NOV20281.1 sll0787 family AIR synthase-like protein [Ensifer canadensis]